MEDRAALKIACRLRGGIKPVARAAAVNHANLTRWLAGDNTLSAEKVKSVLSAIGLPSGQPKSDTVYEWSLNTGFSDITPALRLYFPSGANVYLAPWTSPGRRRLYNIMTLKFLPEIFALTDGSSRAVIRTPAGVWGLFDQVIGSDFRLYGGIPENSTLKISTEQSNWLTGPLSIAEFDAACQGTPGKTLQDLDCAVREIGLSYAEAINILRGQRE